MLSLTSSATAPLSPPPWEDPVAAESGLWPAALALALDIGAPTAAVTPAVVALAAAAPAPARAEVLAALLKPDADAAATIALSAWAHSYPWAVAGRARAANLDEIARVADALSLADVLALPAVPAAGLVGAAAAAVRCELTTLPSRLVPDTRARGRREAVHAIMARQMRRARPAPLLTRLDRHYTLLTRLDKARLPHDKMAAAGVPSRAELEDALAPLRIEVENTPRPTGGAGAGRGVFKLTTEGRQRRFVRVRKSVPQIQFDVGRLWREADAIKAAHVGEWIGEAPDFALPHPGDGWEGAHAATGVAQATLAAKMRLEAEVALLVATALVWPPRPPRRAEPEPDLEEEWTAPERRAWVPREEWDAARAAERGGAAAKARKPRTALERAAVGARKIAEILAKK